MNTLEKFRPIKSFLFDVDGVLTNGEVIVMEDGSLIRQMNVRDGYAMQRAVIQGYRIGIITGGSSKGVADRLFNLGILDIYSGVRDKLEAYEVFVEKYQLEHEEILYMGDDLPDYEVMRRVGFPTCPRNAAPEILEISQYISPIEGGKGCVRDVVEKVLKIHGKWRDEPPQ
ncbi:MAG: HAD-IIIA family hydrolase [Saprospirales bacterium]|nr:HAD-IIIA family hydrolase [Saprospirales bacterium]